MEIEVTCGVEFIAGLCFIDKGLGTAQISLTNKTSSTWVGFHSPFGVVLSTNSCSGGYLIQMGEQTL